ncbi:hypothetical protein OUZ56_029386 [Daphnia magna]|uniref:Uncharacterized protein n=1 Tax=Daphnia magna TaxID=35525 RepID=A0ABR0B6P3_9CRUS|nr:hypothetical protein OUZ56_029386 [Daphnia magna]
MVKGKSSLHACRRTAHGFQKDDFIKPFPDFTALLDNVRLHFLNNFNITTEGKAVCETFDKIKSSLLT